MDELAAFPHWARLPVTLACDGNRRKEVNMVKRSTGFNWVRAYSSAVVFTTRNSERTGRRRSE
jgi:nitrate reductase (NAD(P)H)